MNSPKVLVIFPAWFLLTAAASPTPTPSTPSPSHAYITLDTAAGGPSTNIGVNGYSFPPGATVTLYWDTPSQVAGRSPADSSGFMADNVVPVRGASPGAHLLCADAPGLNQAPPCATFTLQGPPTPTPPPPPPPSSAPTASPSPSSSPSASPVVLTQNSGRGGLDVITKPPLVFLPIIALLGLLGAIAYFLLMRVDRTPVLPSATVVHRTARPDYGPPPARPAAVMQPPPGDLPPPAFPVEPIAQPGVGPPVEPGAQPQDSERPAPPEPPAY